MASISLFERLFDRYATLRLRPPLWQAGFPFLLLWSHKSASTVLAHWYFEQIGAPHRAEPGANYAGLAIHRYQFKVYNQVPGYLDACRTALRRRQPALKFVRDPAARAFSSFLSTRRSAARDNKDFWGFRVRARVLEHLGAGAEDPAHPYSFAQFIEWIGASGQDRLNNHVRQQNERFESACRIEIVPIEDLAEQLLAIESRFGMQPVAARPGLLEAPHHRRKSEPPAPSTIESALNEAVPIGWYESHPPPRIDSALIRDTELGRRVRAVFAADYRAYPLY